MRAYFPRATKSLNVARRIRDALNAPETLVGQTIEVDRVTKGHYDPTHDLACEDFVVHVERVRASVTLPCLMFT